METKTATVFQSDETIPGSSQPTQAKIAEQATNQGIEALKDIVYGSIAGAVGKVFEYPFDTVKVRLQSQPDHLPPRYKGPYDCFRQGFQAGGFRGLYHGISVPLLGASVETACLFITYRLAQDLLKVTVLASSSDQQQLSLGFLATAGAMSGCLTSFALTPIELVKCRMQVPLQSSLDPTLGPRTGLASSSLGPLAVMREVYKREGLRGFWRGQMGTLFRETGGSAAWFGTYETLSLYFKKRLQDPKNDSLPIWQQMASGAAAGVAYNGILFPADTIKSKIQTGELTNVRPTFTGVGMQLWKTHGLKGLYRGCGITLARSVPSSAIMFTIYETFRKAAA